MTRPNLLGLNTRAAIPQDVLLNVSGQNLLTRMLANPLLEGWAVDERSQPYQAIAPAAFEIAEGYLQMARIIWLRSLIGPDGYIAYGPYLDELGDQEMGIYRLSASPARVALRFEGTAAAIIGQGLLVQTTGSPPMQYATNASTTLVADPSAAGGFSGGALADCLELGIAGNVPANTITRFATAPPLDVTSVTNPSAVPLIAGSELESDESYRARLLRYRRDPPNGANAAQFRIWAEEVPGCGRAECIRPMEPVGPQGQEPPPAGTCWVFVTGNALVTPYPGTGLMAPPAVVDAVQQYIAPQRPALDLQPGDAPPVDMPDNGLAQLLAYPLDTAEMAIGGVWTLRLALSLTNPPADLTTPVCTVTVFDVSNNIILDGRPGGEMPQGATHTYTAAELGPVPPTDPSATPAVDFFWNGLFAPVVEARLARSAVEATPGNGIVTMHGGWVLSSFSDPTHEGLAPVNMRVEVYASLPVPIDVEVAVQNKPGWTMAATQAWIEGALTEYLRTIVYGGSAAPVMGLPDPHANDVLYGMVGAVLYGGCQQGDTPLRYYDPSTLRLNGGTTDVFVWTGDVAVLGTVTLSAMP